MLQHQCASHTDKESNTKLFTLRVSFRDEQALNKTFMLYFLASHKIIVFIAFVLTYFF